MFEEAGNTAILRAEAAALQHDLHARALQAVKAEYEFYSDQASAWLGTVRAEDRDALTRGRGGRVAVAEPLVGGRHLRRAMALPNGPALIVGQTSPEI